MNKQATGALRMRLAIMAAMMFFALTAAAQCSFRNTAFKSGEFLSYNLYYNWQFVWVKAGTASMYTVESTYKGQRAFRSSLTTRGNKKVDNMFVLRDTLLCYASTALEPLYFRKGAREGKRYTVDEVFYNYPNGNVALRCHRQHNDGTHSWKNFNPSNCVYDMLNIFLRARSFSSVNWKKGHTVDFPIADGKGTSPARLRFNGTTKIKADNGHKYRCVELSYLEKEDGKWEEIVRFYVTDDQNHVPIRLDMFLRFGSAKAFLTSMKGIRNPITSLVK